MVPDMTKLVTLTGIPQSEIAKRLAEPFPADAYKAVGGSGADLTDINTGYMIERATEVFGLRGLGWKLDYNPTDLVITGDGGRVTAHLKAGRFVYCLLGEDKTPFYCEVLTSGVSTNKIEYAEEGARTSALGAALKALCFQLPVYKGHLDHHNAGRQHKASQSAAHPAGNGKAHTDTELVAWAKEKFGFSGKEVGAALKAGGISAFDPEKWDEMLKLVSEAAKSRQAA